MQEKIVMFLNMMIIKNKVYRKKNRRSITYITLKEEVIIRCERSYFREGYIVKFFLQSI